jgi:hypothetical protein
MAQDKDAHTIEEPTTSPLELVMRDISEKLPEPLRQLLAPHEEPNEYMTALMTVIVASGGLIPNVHTIYDRRRIYPMLMFFAICPPAGGKGVISLSSVLLEGINQKLNNDYKSSLEAHDREISDRQIALRSGRVLPAPIKPVRPLLLFPGNITSAKLIQQMNDNGSLPLVVIETEADVMSGSFKSEHGQLLSTLIRQAYHHEPITYARKTNNEYIEVKQPKMAMVIAGTDSQVTSIFTSNRDGLFSRFLVLRNATNISWRSVKPQTGVVPLDDHYRTWSKWFLRTWEQTRDLDLKVTLTNEQWDLLNEFGERHQAIAHINGGEYSVGVARRHALMVARIAMVLTLFRNVDPITGLVDTGGGAWICNNEDFDVAMKLGEISFQSSIDLFGAMPQPKNERYTTTIRKDFCGLLPQEFGMKEVNAIASTLKIPERTKTRWLRELCDTKVLEHIAQGKYRKTGLLNVVEAAV